jgi:hypothetical protein
LKKEYRVRIRQQGAPEKSHTCATYGEAKKWAQRPLDYRFFFFPWWQCPEYQLQASIPIPQETAKYFEELEAKGIGLYPSQKFWYVKKAETQNTDMMREYPSTPDEAFHTSLEGAYYSRQMLDVRKEKDREHYT